MVVNVNEWGEFFRTTIALLWFVTMAAIMVSIIRTNHPPQSSGRYTCSTIFLALVPFTFIQLIGSAILHGYDGEWFLMAMNIFSLVMVFFIYSIVKRDDNWFDDTKKKFKRKVKESVAKRRRWGVGVTTGGRW